jgi:hypothetical protein
LLCEFSILLEYDKINCNIVSRVFCNVLWSANFSYMK